MPELTRQAALIQRASLGDINAFSRLVLEYQDMAVGYAVSLLGDFHAAEDAAQETLNAFFEGYAKGAYDPGKGRLRKWLFGIATNKIRNLVRRKAQRHEIQLIDGSSETGFLARIPDDAQLEQKWEQQWRRAVFKQCFEEVRCQLDAKTIQAYVKFAEQGNPAEQVAKELEMTCNAVYLAKHHVLKRIRELIPDMEQTW